MTLIELMVGIVVLAVLLAIAVPGFQGYLASSRLTTANNDLVSSLAMARSEAIRRGGRITLCKSANGLACTTAGNWAQGWIVFTDNTRASSDATVDAGETVLASVGASPNGFSIVGDGALENFVSFSADGVTRLMNGSSQAGRVRVCSTSTAISDDRRARDISISVSGRLVTTTPTGVDSSCPLS